MHWITVHQALLEGNAIRLKSWPRTRYVQIGDRKPGAPVNTAWLLFDGQLLDDYWVPSRKEMEVKEWEIIPSANRQGHLLEAPF